MMVVPMFAVVMVARLMSREAAKVDVRRAGLGRRTLPPMAMADAGPLGQQDKGDLVFVLGSGGGMSMAAMNIRLVYNT